MGLFDFGDELEPGIGGAAKRATKAVAGGVKQQVKAGTSDFFKSLFPDLYGDTSQQDAVANASNTNVNASGASGALDSGGDQGVEQPDAAALMKQMQQQQAAQAGGGQSPGVQGHQSQFPGIRTPEEEQKLKQLQKKLHDEVYFAEFGDVDTALKKSQQQQQQLAQQKKQQEEEEKEQKKKQKKQEEEQEKKEVENRQAKREKMPAGAG